ncbi:MAG: ABC transporter permease [Magnetovibrio sp.]|nr:ABC transporter permease [Magnetovibrio sp.]
MLEFVLRRILHSAVSIVGVSIVIFTISRMSGDPLLLLLPMDAPSEVIAAKRIQLGLDRPYVIQYFTFAKNALLGDFGFSYRWNVPALQLVLERLPATIELACAAMVFSLSVAIPFGVFSAVHRGSWFDRFGKVFAMLGQAMPNFWIGLIAIMVFAVGLKWLPAFGRGTLAHLVLPAIALGWYPVAAMTRIIRSGMLDVLDAEYIRMGRAVGAPEWILIWKYAFRNAAIPLVTVLGVYFAASLGGAFVVETVFAWPGLGRTVVEAVFSRDFPVVQAGVLVIAFLFVVTNMIVDISYGLIDPRIRHDR